MIKNFNILICFLFLFSCSKIEFVLKDTVFDTPLKNNALILFEGTSDDVFFQELNSYLGNNQNGEYIIITIFSKKKKNVLVKKNQVAEKVDYEISVEYEVFYKNRNCLIYKKNIISRFSFIPKSFGYNFGAEKSLEKLYKNAIKKNINRLINGVPNQTKCIG